MGSGLDLVDDGVNGVGGFDELLIEVGYFGYG